MTTELSSSQKIAIRIHSVVKTEHPADVLPALVLHFSRALIALGVNNTNNLEAALSLFSEQVREHFEEESSAPSNLN